MQRAAEINARPSRRAVLAQHAATAALAVGGVADTTSGPLGRWLTLDRERRVDGVVAVAGADGRIDVTLYLVAELVPLPSLAERVREAVRAAAQEAGMAGELGAITVAIDAVRSPEEQAC